MYIAEGMTPCQVMNPELWFSKEKSKRTQRAKQLCLSCDERNACLSSTLRFEKRAGVQPCVLGGLTASERAKLLGQSDAAAAA